MAKDRESCGRCSVSIAVEAANGDRTADERDPYGDARIEVDERDLRFVSPDFWIARFAERLDDVAARLTWGR